MGIPSDGNAHWPPVTSISTGAHQLYDAIIVGARCAGSPTAMLLARQGFKVLLVGYRRLVPRLGHAQAIGAITHRLCRLIWKILHQGVRYEERGSAISADAKKVRARKMIRELRSLGYRVEPPPASSDSPA